MMVSRYRDLFDLVVNYGKDVDSRYGMTREITGLQFLCPAGVIPQRPRLNEGIGWQELTQLIAGVYDLEGFKRVAPNAALELFTAHMAYGPRIADQVPWVIDELKADPDSRRAVLFVGHPTDGTALLPCTESIQFLIRDGTLKTIVSMRSWDLVKGLPYDVMMFGGLAKAIARCIRPGLLTSSMLVTAGSGHVYLSDTHLRPREYSRYMHFRKEAPIDWSSFVDWAKFNTRILQKGGMPTFMWTED